MHKNSNISNAFRANFELILPFGTGSQGSSKMYNIAHVYTIPCMRILRSHLHTTSHCGDRFIPADQVSRILLTFPSLPPKPSYTPPLVGQEAMEHYIIPLYLRHWGIYPRIRTGSVEHTWPGLTRIYNMNDSAMAMEFFHKVIHIAEEENVCVIAPNVALILALILCSIFQHPLEGLSIFEKDIFIHTSTFILPNNAGITNSDIRLALLIESCFNDCYAADVKFNQ